MSRLSTLLIMHAAAVKILLPLALLAPGLSPPAYGQEARLAPVRVVVAQERVVQQEIAYAGSVAALRSASLSPATVGLVDQLFVDAGDRVEKGDVLLMLDDELARFQLDSEEATARRAEQAVADARRRLAEARALKKKQTIAETAVRDLESEVIEDEAELARVRAVAQRSRATLTRHALKAPFAGVISARSTDLGEWVTPGITVFELVSTEQLTVDLQVSEAYLGAIAPGAPLTLGFSGGASVAATVSAIVPVTDPVSRTFLVRARADEAHPAMFPGGSVTANIALDSGRRGTAIPRDAVLRYSDGRSVAWVVERVDGVDRADERLVVTGLSFDGLIEIRSGVEPGERVVVAGNEALRDDQTVRILEGG